MGSYSPRPKPLKLKPFQAGVEESDVLFGFRGLQHALGLWRRKIMGFCRGQDSGLHGCSRYPHTLSFEDPLDA